MKTLSRYFSIALIAVILMGSAACFHGRGGHGRDDRRDDRREYQDNHDGHRDRR